MNDKVTIYHNPRCSKSRHALELLRERGVEPEVILYMETPPAKSHLKKLLAMLGMRPRELLRNGEQAYKDKGLADPSLPEDALLDAMLEDPRLIQRPIVVAGGKAVLGRPPENVLDLIG